MTRRARTSVEGLAAELGKRRPFDLPAREAFHAMLRTADLLTRPHEAMFKRHGISRQLYNVLRILLGHEQDPERGAEVGVPSETVAQQLTTRDPDVSRLATRLVDKGLVARLRDPNDGRVVRLVLTPKGRELAQALTEPGHDLMRRQFACLSDDELRTLIATLAKLRAAGIDDPS